MLKERTLEVFLDQINKCNLRCQMCAFSDERVKNLKKDEMPLKVFEKIANQIFPFARYVALSCLTEPHEKIIISLIENGISRIGISLDGAKKET